MPDGSGKMTKQRLVLGTHTSEGEQNYLMLAEVALPLADSEAEARGYDEERGEVGGFGSAAGRVQVRGLPSRLLCWSMRAGCSFSSARGGTSAPPRRPNDMHAGVYEQRTAGRVRGAARAAAQALWQDACRCTTC